MKSNTVIRRKELAATISFLLASYSGIALAQDQAADADQVDELVTEEVIVTGIRRGLMNSIDLKSTETSIVEAVSAEDIGKLPDISITDSLARLPGVTAQRLNGRSQVLSVRGLGPDFTTALLNGRPQVSSGDNRGVEFDQYPSEMISAGVVYKTPDATLMGQGLAGTIDMRTIRPLEYGKQAFMANARYIWNDISALNDDAPDDGWRGSFTYVDQFMDDTLGVAFGIAYADTPTQSERFNAWGYPTVSDGTQDVAIIGGAKPFAQSNQLERTGIIGTLEYQPSDTFRTIVDLSYTDFAETQVLRGIELPLAWSSAQWVPGSGSIDDGLVDTGTFTGVKGVMRNDVNDRQSELFAAGWTLEFNVGDKWILTGDLSYSKVDRTDILLETYSGTGPNGEGATDTLGFVMRSGQGALFSSTLDYTDPNLIMLASPQGWGADVVDGGQLGYNNSPTIEDELTALDLRAEYEIGGAWASSVVFGLNYQTREKNKIADEWFLALANGEISAPLPTPNGFTDLSFIGIYGMVTYDPLQAIADGTYSLNRNPNADVIIKSWIVEEDVTTAYAMLNFDTDVGSTMMYGNVGVQVVSTDQSSRAIAASGGGSSLQGVPNTGGDSYTEVLPSLNMTFDLGNNNLLRFAAARTLARARMDQLRASLEWGFDASKADSEDINNSPWSGSGGNPELRPWMANSFDVSFEKYLDDGIGYFSAAAWYKDLDSWVSESPAVFDFTGYPTGGITPVLNEGLVTIPQSEGGGNIYGFEIAGALDFGVFTPTLNGLGLIASASFTKSNVKVDGNDVTLPGLSEDVYNLTAYYETERFSIRASGRYRSEFLGEVSGFGDGRDFRTVAEETVWDAQASWFFGGKATGLSLLFQVYNLTDEAFSTFSNDDDRQIIDYQRYGRTYLIGASYGW